MTDIEKAKISMTIKIAVSLGITLFVFGWRGSSWYNGIIDQQKSGTALLSAKIDSVRYNQGIININTANELQRRIDADRRFEEFINSIK